MASHVSVVSWERNNKLHILGVHNCFDHHQKSAICQKKNSQTMEGVNYVISAVLFTAMMIWLIVGAVKCWKRKDHCSMGAILTIAGEVALFPG